jgi:hypothetical protein
VRMEGASGRFGQVADKRLTARGVGTDGFVDSPLEGNGFELSVPRCLAAANSVGAFMRR